MHIPTILVLDATDELGLQVKRAVAGLRPRPQVVPCAGFEAVGTVLESHPRPDVLIAGPGVVSDGGLQQIRELRLRLPQASLILAFDRWRSAKLRETIRTGAVDILRLPASDQSIAETIEQALEVRTDSESNPGVSPRAGTAGEVIAIVSATGGCGKTFLTTNLAYHLQSRFQKRTCLVDLDLQFGELSTALRLKPRSTITDLLAGDEDESLSDRLAEHLVVHDTGMHVLAAPDQPAEADAVDAADVGRVIEAARAAFDYVIVDTPASLSEAVLAVLEYADRVFAMATLDLPSVRNLGLLLATMKRLKVPAERVKLVLNKVEPDVGMDVAQITRYFPQGFSVVVPYGREANRALNMGMPLLAFAPRSDVSRALIAGLATAMPVEPDVEVEESTPRHRFARLRLRPA
ncbi:MAG: pilus assembly protein CpaE [Actinomycetota bacterium]|nr:pilus assembly protein CpaE [Actinomycetota bacterium]MEA2842906.1 pilus assembly protein CpaE [Actinomycetota bacterium]